MSLTPRRVVALVAVFVAALLAVIVLVAAPADGLNLLAAAVIAAGVAILALTL